jgi:hypothetical protein
MADTDGADVGGGFAQRVRETNWIALVSLGIVSFVLGMIFTGLLIVLFGRQPGGGLYGIFLLVGFTFYAGHLVNLVTESGVQFGFFGGVEGTAVPLEAYYAVPIIVLLGAGVLATHRLATRAVDPLQIGLHVAGIALGYALMAVLGSFTLVTENVMGETVTVATEQALLYGLLFPLIFATLGAAFESARRYINPG